MTWSLNDFCPHKLFFAVWTDEVDDVYITTPGKIAKALKVPITDLLTLIDEENE